MNYKLNELINLYQRAKFKNPNLFLYDDVETLFYYNVYKECYNIQIKLIKTEEIYKIFIFLSQKGKILFNCLINESKYNLQKEYTTLKSTLNTFSINELINNYYEKIKLSLIQS